MKTLSFSESYSDETIRRIAKRMDFVSKNIEECKTFISKSTDISKLQNWERMNKSTAHGESVGAGTYIGMCFDGRYIYFAHRYSFPYKFLRFDTTLSFTNSSAWEKMSVSTAQGGSALDNAYYGSCFDGRYIYYCARSSETFLRFDTTLSFTNSSAWEKMNMSTAQGGSTGTYFGNCFDGRYVYFTPRVSNTFLRFDTTQSFTNSSAWEKMNLSTLLGSSLVDSDFYFATNCFDGRYIYTNPSTTDTFLRFDTTQNFTNSSAWEKMNLSTAQGAATLDNTYRGSCFDGRYIYYSPYASYTFLRFDTTLSFTNSSAWERMNVSTAQGASKVTDYIYSENCFDGRYIYYCARSSETFLRFDTTLSFTNSSAWEKMNMSTAQGGSIESNLFFSCCFDGKYIYFGSTNSYTFLRVKACSL